jgi:hypothetical protein
VVGGPSPLLKISYLFAPCTNTARYRYRHLVTSKIVLYSSIIKLRAYDDVKIFHSLELCIIVRPASRICTWPCALFCKARCISERRDVVISSQTEANEIAASVSCRRWPKFLFISHAFLYFQLIFVSTRFQR